MKQLQKEKLELEKQAAELAKIKEKETLTTDTKRLSKK